MILLYATASSTAEAERIATALIEEQLAACANVIPGMRAVYRWEGKVCTDDEVVLIVKTDADHAEQAQARLCELHSYDVPCVLRLEPSGGNPAYLDWLAGCLRPS